MCVFIVAIILQLKLSKLVLSWEIWAFLVAQMVKNLLTMRETWVWFNHHIVLLVFCWSIISFFICLSGGSYINFALGVSLLTYPDFGIHHFSLSFLFYSLSVSVIPKSIFKSQSNSYATRAIVLMALIIIV